MLGTIAKGKIIDKNDKAYYVQIDGITYELKKHEITQDDIPKIVMWLKDLFMIIKIMIVK